MVLEANRTIVRSAGSRFWETYRPNVSNKDYIYEKASANSELVAGRICSLGTADYQLKYYDEDKGMAGVFDMQIGKGGYSDTTITHGHLNYNDLYAIDDDPVKHISNGIGILQGTLDDGQTVTKGDSLQAENGTGKLQKQTTGQLVGIACEDLDLSGTPGDSLLYFKPIFDSPRIKVETLTADTHVITLSHVPIDISYIDIKTGTAAGAILPTYTDATPVQGQAYGVKASKTITFNATDAVLTAEVCYTF